MKHHFFITIVALLALSFVAVVAQAQEMSPEKTALYTKYYGRGERISYLYWDIFSVTSRGLKQQRLF